MPGWSPFEPDRDRRLVEGLNEGAEGALGICYDEYAERIHDYCRSLSLDAAAAADVVHDTFIDAFRRAPRMRDRTHLPAWLYGAARRRCLRGPGPAFDLELIAAADAADDAPDGEIARLALSALPFSDQEILVLALRHGLGPIELAGVLGLNACRTATRLERARNRFSQAIDTEVAAAELTCAAATEQVVAVQAGRPAERAEPPAGAADGPGHSGDCPACVLRSRSSHPGLFAPVVTAELPEPLRYRVLHTATDPELSGYRADIVARGGNLTSTGMPRQPDVLSEFTRRWLFVGGGVVGALATTLVLALMIGPVTTSDLYWPFQPGPEPSAIGSEPGDPSGSPSAGTTPGPQREATDTPAASPDADPSTGDEDPAAPDPGQGDDGADVAPPAPPGAAPGPVQPGRLSVGPSDVQLGAGRRSTVVQLTAAAGPVDWSAATSSSQVSVSARQGVIVPGETVEVQIVLAPALVTLPGSASVTFTDGTAASQVVQVSWGLGIL